MNKVVLSTLGVVAVALLVWALMPTAQSPIDPPAIAPVATTAEKNPIEGEAPEGSAARPATPKAAARPATAAPTGGGEGNRLAAPQLLPPLMPMPEGEVKPPDQARYGRKPGTPMPRLDPAEFKRAVRNYYGNLPRKGRMPSRITVEEVFPPALYEGLNIPPASQVVEIGHYPATSPEGLAEILETPDEGTNTFGLTVVTPDGQRIRDYIQLSDEPDTPR